MDVFKPVIDPFVAAGVAVGAFVAWLITTRRNIADAEKKELETKSLQIDLQNKEQKAAIDLEKSQVELEKSHLDLAKLKETLEGIGKPVVPTGVEKLRFGKNNSKYDLSEEITLDSVFSDEDSIAELSKSEERELLTQVSEDTILDYAAEIRRSRIGHLNI